MSPWLKGHPGYAATDAVRRLGFCPVDGLELRLHVRCSVCGVLSGPGHAASCLDGVGRCAMCVDWLRRVVARPNKPDDE